MAKHTLSQSVATARRRLAAETGAVTKDWGGRLPLALVYPNSYYLGMSNLGLQAIYALLNARSDVVCERAFYDPPPADQRGDDRSLGPVTIESQRPLTDFPVVAYTLTYEIDYYHVVRSLQAAGIAPLSANRDEGAPIVIAGGASVITNPLPLADCFDAFVIGEAEPILDQLVDCLVEYAHASRAELLEQLAQIPGVFVPLLGPGEGGVERQWVRDIATTEAISQVLTDDTEFSQMTLIEAARGCGRGCRFCIAGYVFRPPRYRPLSSLVDQVARGLNAPSASDCSARPSPTTPSSPTSPAPPMRWARASPSPRCASTTSRPSSSRCSHAAARAPSRLPPRPAPSACACGSTRPSRNSRSSTPPRRSAPPRCDASSSTS